MYQSPTNRSRQLLYIALAVSIFSIASISYKYIADSEREQTVGQLDCLPGDTRDIADSTCNEITIDERIQFSSLNE